MSSSYPEDKYLAKVGQLAYAVSHLEWLILGDLSRHPDLPASLTVANRAGRTTGGIAAYVRRAASDVAQHEVRDWLLVGARRLEQAAAIRNHLLHARPATVDGKQRLHRWRLQKEVTDAFTISDDWLDEQLRTIEWMHFEVDALRMDAWRWRERQR